MTTTSSWIDAWRAGNHAGHGYGIGDECDHLDRAQRQSPEAAALAEGWEIVERCREPELEDAVLARRPDGQLVAVCDLYGPWAVDVEA